ncbi:MAG: nucleotidyl transferase AbiEii/AbiGii toxin family protein [Syntrophaceae bacterium]|nr:nucleotidyl transferase AbiEii/AbiGii toxin family protein [Syntrophaceae bacterium]
MFENALLPKVRELLKQIAPTIHEEHFYLAGGTGLALQIGHRLSDDLVFFTGSHFNETLLISNLRAKVQSYQEILIERQTVSLFLDSVRCSFFFYDVPLLFETLKIGGIEAANWRDILAEKFKAVSQRGNKKDFYDIFSVIKAKNLSIEEAVAYLIKRFKSTGLNRYHVLRSLTYFEDAEEEPDPISIGDHQYSWEVVKAFFIENIKEFERVLMR